jgi:4-amino-4-deoxy-L-arabinose transferase-like glycosyltransferase
MASAPRPIPQLRAAAPPWVAYGPWTAILVLGLATALRLLRLSEQNIWWDEGWTMWLARLDPVSIAIRTAVDAHPPLHYLLMHYWMQAAGSSAFAGRLFSVLAGVLMVAVLYRLARNASGPRLAALAAGLLALARFHVWWSQDIKNYTLAGVFALLSLWLTLRLWDSPAAVRRWRPWLGYVAASALGLFSHYLVALIVLANNVYALIRLLALWRQRRALPMRELGGWSLAQIAVLALFLPWLALHLRLATIWEPTPPVDLGFFLQLTATLFSLGVVHNLNEYLPLVGGMLALAGLGAAWAWRGKAVRQRGAALLAGLVVVLPPLVIYVASLSPASFFAPQIAPRYLLMFSPAYLLLAALGVLALSQRSPRLGLTALVIVVAAQVWTLSDYYRTRRWTDDLYTLTNVINNFAQPGDGVLLHTDHDWPVFLYYLRAPIGWDGVLSGYAVDEATAVARAETMTGRYKRVWVVVDADALAKDPRHLVVTALAERLPRQLEATYGSHQLLLYAPQSEPAAAVPEANFRPQWRRTEPLAPGLTLLGFDFPEVEASTGDDLFLVTYWTAEAPAPLRVDLLDPAGRVAGATAQTVSAGTRVRLESRLALPPGASGRYTVVVAAGGQAATLAHVRAQRLPEPPAAHIATHTDFALGEAIRLVGYNVPQRQARAGQALPVILFWQGTAPVPASYKVFVHLVGSEWNTAQDNPLWGQVDQLPLDSTRPTDTWTPGQVLTDPYRVPVDPNAPAGVYTLTVGLYDPVSGERLPVYDVAGALAGDEVVIGQVEVVP